MADEKGSRERMSSQYTAINAPFKADHDVIKDMQVPETITVQSMQNFGENKPAFQGSQMTVPDKIVLNGESETQVYNPSMGLQNAGVNLNNYMGGMVTPPRTLTVDDTTSRYMERKVEGNDGRRKEFDRLPHQLGENSGNSDEDSGTQLQGEIVRLNKRVESLEKKMSEKQSNGFWKTTFVCLLTIINPIIIHWLFSSRRR